ncbi:hypothetical protein M404DRAFT_25947 [Pisolithus tinctorius Marx 270]|uniref:Uncharacterized protein n=1 Tax=Pisolithus tinctorius Marx 270 TaxID=870435 RepID=A0A0C3PB50_PISTI|nr:hypothetical protein M404DRAFT_25947 [Pisolithus tinctorius Marx 270]
MGPLGNCPSSLTFEDRHAEKSNSSKQWETTRARRFQESSQTHTHSHMPTPITSSSAITLDVTSPYSTLNDSLGFQTHDPSNIMVSSVGIDVTIDGLEEGYKEGYDGIADAEGKDDMMEQGDNAENARGVAE